MDEYIKRETALKAIDEYFRTTNPDGDEQIGVLKSRRIIRALPSAYVAPVRHGRWLCVDTDTEQFFLCNRCKKKEYLESNYCPNCGAKMEGQLAGGINNYR